MSDKQTVSVHLVPMTDEDYWALREARGFIGSFGSLGMPEDWTHWETGKALNRIISRYDKHSSTFEIPMPIDQRDGEPLFVGEKSLV